MTFQARYFISCMVYVILGYIFPHHFAFAQTEIHTIEQKRKNPFFSCRETNFFISKENEWLRIMSQAIKLTFASQTYIFFARVKSNDSLCENACLNFIIFC